MVRSSPEAPLTVDELTAQVTRALSGFSRVVVEGEVTGARPTSSGHLYFTLRGDKATLGCTAWRSTIERLKRIPRDGDRVVCSGAVEVYAPHGSYRLIASGIKYQGEGELLLAFEALKTALHREGLFAAGRKRALPWIPRRIGVVTAATGAALADIIRSIHVRFPAKILLAAAPVQGQGAHRTLIAALRALDQIEDVDVIVIGRGGGSLEDLWEFNQEALVRAIAACQTPVVSAVGHEIDWMLTDYVADARAATPTAVGELVVPELRLLTESLMDSRRKLRLSARALLDRSRLRLKAYSARVLDPRRLLNVPRLRVADLEERLGRGLTRGLAQRRTLLAGLYQRLMAAHPSARAAERRTRLSALEARLTRALAVELKRLAARVDRGAQKLAALSPLGVLNRGYAIVQDRATGDVVRSASRVAEGQALVLRLGDGRAFVRVEGEVDL